MDIDTLWQLAGERERTPQWHSLYMPGLGAGSDDDSDPVPQPKTRGKKPLAITNDSHGDDTDGSMPGLQSVSNSSEEEMDQDDGSDDAGDDHGDDYDDALSDESGYDTEEEDELRDKLREAMDIAHEAAFFDSSGAAAEVDLFAEERKGNPFLKLLGSLRGAFLPCRSTVSQELW
jgi:hypothetical protein